MLFQLTQEPPSTRTQKESSLVVGAWTRPQIRYVPAVATLNGTVAYPVVGGLPVLLLPAATVTYRPPEAVGSERICIGALTVPPSASVLTVVKVAGSGVELVAWIRSGAPVVVEPLARYPLTPLNPVSYGLAVPRSTVTPSRAMFDASSVRNAGRSSLLSNWTAQLTNRIPLACRIQNPYEGRVPYAFGV